MARVRVHNFTISLDGYGAGPLQTRENPLGVGAEALHEWFIPTRAFQRINGKSGGTTGVDEQKKDVQIGGGVSTIRQYLEAGLIDELHVAISPTLLGTGEHLLYGLDLPALGYECTSHVPTAGATHIVLTRRQ